MPAKGNAMVSLLVSNDTFAQLADALRSADVIPDFRAIAAAVRIKPKRFADALETYIGALDAEGRGAEAEAWFIEVRDVQPDWRC